MDKTEAIKYIETKGDSKYIVRTEDEEKVFLENFGLKVEEEKIKPQVRKIYDQYEGDILSVSGIKKESGEKAYDYAKRVIGEFKTKAERTDAIEKEMSSLKEQIKAGTGDKQLLADLEAVRKAYKELEDSKDKEVGTLKSDYDKFKVRSEISSALSGMVFKKNIPEPAIKAFTDQVINELTNIASLQDGKLVFMKDGVPMRNAHNALNPYTAKELLEERMKEIRDTGKTLNGGPDVSKEITKEFDKTGKVTKIAMIIPDSVKSKVELSEYLVKAGLLRGTEDYNLAYKEYSASLPMR